MPPLSRCRRRHATCSLRRACSLDTFPSSRWVLLALAYRKAVSDGASGQGCCLALVNGCALAPGSAPLRLGAGIEAWGGGVGGGGGGAGAWAAAGGHLVDVEHDAFLSCCPAPYCPQPDTLFYIFYGMPGDEAQLYAADELANR